MWAASFYGSFMNYQFGNFNGMAAYFNCMGFSANMFNFSCGYVFPARACIPYAMVPGNFLPFHPLPALPPSNFNADYYQDYKEDHRRGLNASPAQKVRAVSPPPCNFGKGHHDYQMYKGDHPRSLNVSPAQKVRAISPVPPSYFNDGHSRRYDVDRPRRYEVDRPRRLSANLPRNASAASQWSSRPSVSQFTENPQRYLDFVLVMVISTGKLEVLNWREASEKRKQVKIVSTWSELKWGRRMTLLRRHWTQLREEDCLHKNLRIYETTLKSNTNRIHVMSYCDIHIST